MKYPTVQLKRFMLAGASTLHYCFWFGAVCGTNLCKGLRKISDNFLTNKPFVHFSRFSFTSVVSITYGCKVLGPYATSFIRSSSIIYKNLKIVRLQSHNRRICYEKKKGFLLELVTSSYCLTPKYFMIHQLEIITSLVTQFKTRVIFLSLALMTWNS